MMVKGDQEGLSESDLYVESQEIFNYYLQCIIEFSQQFDPTETLMIIANDPIRREFIHTSPDIPVPLSYIINDLWPKLGFLPIDPENPGVALIAEFMLNELILKNSDSLEELNLQHLKELFSGDGEEGEMDEQEAYEAMEAMAAMDAMEDYDEDDQYEQEMRQLEENQNNFKSSKKAKRPSDKKSDNYSSDDSDKGDVRFMDINDLKRNQSSDKNKKKMADDDDSNADREDNYEDEDFNN